MITFWDIDITLAVISAVFAILIFKEFTSLRSELGGKISSILIVISILLLLQSIINASAFIMWSHGRDPIYVYPSFGMAVISTATIILLYYYVAKV